LRLQLSAHILIHMSVREVNKKTVNINALLQTGTRLNDRHVPSHDQLKRTVEELKKRKLKVVLTQGVFDLIHEGHAKYLELAKSQGDILIVGVDSDELTRQRKGPGRPIVPQKERVEMLAHLRHVDVVVVREAQHDIGDLIRLVKPDVLVTSASTEDFTDQMKKEYGEYCGNIVTLVPQGITHTSARIRDLTIDGAEQLAKEINRITLEFINRIRGK
jgi:D-glycero-beta-D-manno-heptose 1-phosphate adenylyltransferase